MENPDHRNPSGHENHGVHLCHKCGWPFPNAHPSAKHRRAHKKICGTIEGYTLIDSEEHTHLTASDDEHRSDEDQPTPSPIVEKGSIKEIGERSNRSEYEVFSDAVTEFSDSGFSPGIEERLKGIRVSDSDKNVENSLEGNQDASQSLKVDATTDPTELLNSATESREVYNPGDIESATTRPFQDTTTEVPAVVLSSKDGLACDLSSTKSESPTDAPKETISASVGGMRDLMTCLGQQTDVKGNIEDGVDNELTDVAEPPSNSASEASGAESKLQVSDGKSSDLVTADGGQSDGLGVKMSEHEIPPEVEPVGHMEEEALSKTASEASGAVPKLLESDGKHSDPMTVDGVAESKQGQSDGSGVTMSEHDLGPEVKSVEHTEASFVNTVQIKADSAHDLIVDSHDGLVEVCDTNGKGKETMYVLSVANDFPVVDHPDTMIEDFKDRKGLKSNLPLTLGSAEVIRSLEDGDKDTVYEESHSSRLGGSIYNSSGVMNSMEDNLKHEGEDSKLINEVPTEGEADTSEFKVSSGEDLGSNGIEAPPGTSRSETEKNQTNHSLLGLQPHSFENESSQEILSEDHTMDLSDANPMVTSIHDEDHRTTDFSGGDNADDYGMVKNVKFVTVGNESCEGAANTKPALKSADSLCVTKVDETTNLPGGDDMGEKEKARVEISDIVQSESTEDAAIEEKCAMNTKTKCESAHHLLESTEVDIDASHLGNMTQTHSSSQKHPVADSQEVIKEPEINDSEVVVGSVGAGSTGSQAYHNGDVEISVKISEKPILEEPGPLATESEFSTKSSSTVEGSHSRDGGKGPSGIISEPMQEEGDDKLTKQNCGASSVYVSVDSSSQTDSLEGNWGSISVLSTQSDAPASIDTEALLSTDSQAPGKSENANLQKPQVVPEGSCSDKSDVFEHPSFMTLVESGGGIDQKAATSEIKTIQNTQQPSAEALQAGWFPSLTTVVNESQGRKKNEERIAKVTNWSTGKQHTPLKNLLGEASVETKRETATLIPKDETAANNNGALATTVNSVLGAEAPIDTKRETGKEWNSPARYPIENKKEKRKVKGKPSWVPFVCCSSVN